MASNETLLPYGEVTRRLRIRSQQYVGVEPIRLEKVVGSVDRRNADVDRAFRPMRRELRDRMRRLREAFAQAEMPPIEVYEVGGMYFVVDGHHRVAVAREAGAEYIDAQVTSVEISHRLDANVDVLRSTNRNATWADAAASARREGVPRGEQEALKRERRSPLPASEPTR